MLNLLTIKKYFGKKTTEFLTPKYHNLMPLIVKKNIICQLLKAHIDHKKFLIIIILYDIFCLRGYCAIEHVLPFRPNA